MSENENKKKNPGAKKPEKPSQAYTHSDTQMTPSVPVKAVQPKADKAPKSQGTDKGGVEKGGAGASVKTGAKKKANTSAKKKPSEASSAIAKKKKKKKKKEKVEIIYVDKEKNVPVKTDEEGNVIVYKTMNPLLSLMTTILYIVIILLVAATLSAVVIAVGNDVFAFKKDPVTAEIYIPEYTTTSDLAAILHENGIINYPSVFKLYSKLKKDNAKYVEGTYTVSTAMNYDQLIRAVKSQAADRTIVTIVIPEGYTVDEIIDLFLENGIGTREGFVDAIQNGVYDYEFIRRLDATELDENRRYRLEGYLFPDTYYFYQDWSETLVINKLLENFNNKFPKEYYEYIDKTKMTVDDYMIIASLVQAEAKFSEDFENISAVFHNRLNNPAKFPYLESDATIQYAYGTHKEDLTHEDTEYDHPYNTYKYKGLPPGPICCPGSTAISNAISPPSDFNYYYFVSAPSGETYYAKTYEEHLKNIALARGE